jgi:branched-chain amino acid transport system permease protein
MTSKFELKNVSSITLAVILAVVPLILKGGYVISLLAQMFFFVALAQSWNLISGYCGYFSLGHQAYYGIGAYGAAILATKLGFNNIILTVLIGGVIAAFMASVIGFITLGVRGPYFVIVTLIFSHILYVAAANTSQITGGVIGITLPPVYCLNEYYYGLFILTILLFYISSRLRKSGFGLAVLAIRENEDAAVAFGINTTKYKVITFVLSAFFTGLVGGLSAWYLSYIDPSTAFNVALQLDVVAITLLGGMGTAIGPLIGGLVFTFLSEFLKITFVETYLILIGVILISVMFFEPSGIVGLVNRLRGRVGKLGE